MTWVTDCISSENVFYGLSDLDSTLSEVVGVAGIYSRGTPGGVGLGERRFRAVCMSASVRCKKVFERSGCLRKHAIERAAKVLVHSGLRRPHSGVQRFESEN